MKHSQKGFVRKLRSTRDALGGSVSVFLRDVGNGLLEVSHNSLALVGLVVVAAALFVLGQADIRHSVETTALGWLQARQEARTDPVEVEFERLAEADAVSRATAARPSDLTRQQSAVAHWLAKRYRVAPEPVSRLVQEAWAVGSRVGVDPTLILAIMAIESSFNPFAQSPVGAQGLMQVMTRVHDEKYERFGGILAAFDPVSNLRVGVQVLKECIARAGSVEGGLRHYVGAGNQETDNGYAGRVLAEQGYLRHVAGGKAVPPNTSPAAAAAAKPAATLVATPPVAPAAMPAPIPAATPAAKPVAGPEDAERVALLR